MYDKLCEACGDPTDYKGRCYNGMCDEVLRLRHLVESEIEALEEILNPPPPPSNAIHASSFGSAGGSIVEGSWKNWAQKRLDFLKR